MLSGRRAGGLAVTVMMMVALLPSVAVAADDPVVTLRADVNGCNGVRTTPGSENTLKRLVGGTLEPGGTAIFEISFPVDPADVAGRTTFVITDCVFVDDQAVLKYSVSFVPNTEDFTLTIALDIPAGAPLGSEYCNYAKTTAAPSESQASNRKAGPACFIVGGSLRVTKVAGSPGGPGLAGADFSVSCQLPTTTSFLPDTIINVQGHAEYVFTSTSGGVINQDVTTGSDGAISVQAPVATVCTFAETAPPTGYDGPAVTDCVLTVAVDSQGTCTFVNILTPTPTPTPTPTGGVGVETDQPTLPPTDTISAPSGPSDGAFQRALIVLAGLLAGILVLTPAGPLVSRAAGV
jgi:hypothetical protein